MQILKKEKKLENEGEWTDPDQTTSRQEMQRPAVSEDLTGRKNNIFNFCKKPVTTKCFKE